MEVSIIFKIAAVGILVSILSQILKHSGRDEQAFWVSLAGLLVVMFFLWVSAENILADEGKKEAEVLPVEEELTGEIKEEMLGKLSDLLHTAVYWALHTLTGVVLGLQVIRSLVTPVMDTLKRIALGRMTKAIPRVGNAMNLVTELFLTSAVLVRNSLGVVFLLVFFWQVRVRLCIMR